MKHNVTVRINDEKIEDKAIWDYFEQHPEVSMARFFRKAAYNEIQRTTDNEFIEEDQANEISNRSELVKKKANYISKSDLPVGKKYSSKN